MKQETKIAVLTGIMGLGVTFLLAQLIGAIAWNWVWVLCPFWIPTATVTALGSFAFLGNLANKAMTWLIN